MIIFVNRSVWFLTDFKDTIRFAFHSLEVAGDLKLFLSNLSHRDQLSF